MVGSGIAGLACALDLAAGGREVWLFDKGHRPGGRIATRHVGAAAFDDGAQFATARGPSFRAALLAWAQAGAAAIWPAASTGGERWVGVPDMAAIPSQLARSLPRPPEQACHVGFLHKAADGWYLRHRPAAEAAPGEVFDEGGECSGPFAAVLVTAPAPQAARLLGTAGHAFAGLALGADYAPCWAVSASFPRRLDIADVTQAGLDPIGWLARCSSRPGREQLPERFVLHATGAWSREWLERDEASVCRALLAALPDQERPLEAAARRWRYAKVETALGQPFLWDAREGLGAGGDWCLGGRVEAAWDSGRALAQAVLAG